MAQATHAAFDARHGVDSHAASNRPRVSAGARHDVRLSIHNDLAAVEQDWRAFERTAGCTVFQTFDWMSAWYRNIGVRNGVVPVIVTGRDSGGSLLFILPLAIETGKARRLTWFASDICDYNMPLLAPEFSRHVGRERFLEVWRDLVGRLQSHPDFRYDLIHFEKMPEQVGGQLNPMLGFRAVLNPSNAYLTALGADWDSFYTAKRSSATRRRDRTKRKRLGEFGEVKFVTAAGEQEIRTSFEILKQQKSLQFARMGVANLFAKPGYPEFYRELAECRPDLIHISRLDVGAVPAAVNYGVMFRGCYYHVLASYTDHEMCKYGPGAAHLHDLMGYAITHGCKTFDFTIGDERYKRDWYDTELKLYDHIAIATARGAMVAGPLLAARAVKRWIKQTPIVWDTFTRLRALAGSLRGKSVEDKAAD
jgi:CelD/BcsL family acetyltransferase involved in cellulose biosynthesis